MSELDKLKYEMQEIAFGSEAPSNKQRGLCIQCKEPALANCYSDAGRAEVGISGICEKCFDKMFTE